MDELGVTELLGLCGKAELVLTMIMGQADTVGYTGQAEIVEAESTNSMVEFRLLRAKGDAAELGKVSFTRSAEDKSLGLALGKLVTVISRLEKIESCAGWKPRRRNAGLCSSVAWSVSASRSRRDAPGRLPIVVRRIDGGPSVVVEDASLLAHAFFTSDPSSVGPEAYDQRAGRGDLNRITTDDVRTINQTMRARSRHTAWETLTSAGPLPWLAVLDPSWDLIELPDRSGNGWDARNS